MINNLANILTVTRVLLLPFIVVLLFLPFHWAAWTCLALYGVAAITDFLDGWVARRFDQVTAFGRFLDPIADKIFVVTILLMLVAVDRVTGVSVIPVIAILAREFAVSGLREFLGPKNVVIHVSPLAKWKTALQMLSTGFLIVGAVHSGYQTTGLILLWAAAVLTVYTGAQYLRGGLKHLDD